MKTNVSERLLVESSRVEKEKEQKKRKKNTHILLCKQFESILLIGDFFFYTQQPRE